MNGFLGTLASIGADLSLVSTLIFAVMAFWGAIQAHKKRFSTHCPVMAVVAFLNAIPVLFVMLPKWLAVVRGNKTLVTGPLSRAPIVHSVLGGLI